jgi:hypothetical protein
MVLEKLKPVRLSQAIGTNMPKGKVLHDATAVKTKVDGYKEWSFKAPSKDVSHSGCIAAGNYYGAGYKTPVGKEKAGSMKSGPIPQSSHCFSPHEIFDHEDKRG